MTELEQPPQNGIDLSAAEDDESSKARPADIEQDMREMERRKRVEAIMGSKLFREELERIVDCARDSGNTDGILQQLSDIVGVPSSRIGSVFKASTSMLPINDIRGIESMGYAKGEKILRCKLAATFRLLDLYGWTQGLGSQITARLKVDQEYFLVNPYGLLHHEITASSLNKVDMQGNIVEQGTTNFGVNKSHFVLHSIVHAARPDIRCAIYIGCTPVAAISSLKSGLLPLTKDACVLGELSTYSYIGYLNDEEERNKLVRNLGPNSKVMLLTNHGALCCGATIEEAFFAACHIVQACETQLKLLPVGLDNLVLIPEESRKIIYDQSRRPPEDLEKKFATVTIADSNKSEEDKKADLDSTTKVIGQVPKWRVGGAEFEALMRMLDNAGYRTGYIYRHPLIKSEPPKPKNDVELPPAVSSLGYLLEEEELFRQGIWKKGDMRKGGDRSRWLNSPNVYQKVEVLETGTPDPKKITKWVAEGSPTHSTPVRIEDPLQFVPVNTNPKEFKRVQQQIKDNRRADKISAGPQSHILEGVTWDEANRIKDATVSSAGDHVVLMGAASKGIIQRGFQHNATVYKAPYAKNPFDNVTDDELNEYKRTVERKKKSIHGEYTDTDFSESEGLSSLQTSGAQQQTKQTTTTITAAVSQSEPEDISEHHVMRIQTEQAPVPSQPEVVLSDDDPLFLNVSQDPKIHQSIHLTCHSPSIKQHQSITECGEAIKSEEGIHFTDNQEKYCNAHDGNKHNVMLIKHLEQNVLFRNRKDKMFHTHSHTYSFTQEHNYEGEGNGNLSNLYVHNSSYQRLPKGENDFFDSSYLSYNTLRSERNHYRQNLYSKDKYLTLLRTKICCSPKVCDKIFESLVKTKSSTNQSTIKNYEILNMPLHRFNATTEKRLYTKSNFPYRTVSHFGFNKPMQEPRLYHKHLATKKDASQNYIPLTRSESYEDIFSSTRYINLCECCFELIVRLKPELMKCKTKLHNLTQNADSRFKLSSGTEYFTGATGNKNVSLYNDDNANDLSENDNLILELCEPCSIFSLNLNDIEHRAVLNKNLYNLRIRNSTFNDQIAKMNMELSLNTSNTSNFKKSVNFNESNCKNDIVDSCYYENVTRSDVSEVCNLGGTFVNEVQNEQKSKKLMSQDEYSKRKLQFHDSWDDNIHFVDHLENEFLYHKNVGLVKQNYQIVIDTNNDVEEFESTLSRIFCSTEQQEIKRKDFDNQKSKDLNLESGQSKNDINKSSQVIDITENLTALRDPDNSFAFIDNENKENLSILERTILEKIHINDLNKSEQIFQKIENTIRNKITPYQLELKIKELNTLLKDENNSNDKPNILSKSLNTFNERYLSSFENNSSTDVVSKMHKKSYLTGSQKNTIVPTEANNESRVSPHLKKSIGKDKKKKRNFILENIRNVSIPRSKFNIDKKFKNNQNCTSSGIIEHKKGLKCNPNIISPRNSSSSTVYSFQSKSVRGSPRFWISMTQSLNKKPHPISSARITHDSTSPDTSNTSGVNGIETKIVNNVDAEIDALGDEILQIQPRLINYERKLDDFSHRIANCVNNINDCVTTQENILSAQKKIQDCIKLREYTEEIMCRAETFSLSETED